MRTGYAKQVMPAVLVAIAAVMCLGCTNKTREIEIAIRDGDSDAAVRIASDHASEIDCDANLVVLEQGEVDEGYKLIHLAAQNDMPEVINVLLSYGCDVNDSSNLASRTPLHEAVSYRSYNALHTLIELGADLERQDEYYQTPLMLAVVRDDLQSANILLSGGANVNYRLPGGRTLFDFSRSESMGRLLGTPAPSTNSADVD